MPRQRMSYLSSPAYHAARKVDQIMPAYSEELNLKEKCRLQLLDIEAKESQELATNAAKEGVKHAKHSPHGGRQQKLCTTSKHGLRFSMNTKDGPICLCESQNSVILTTTPSHGRQEAKLEIEIMASPNTISHSKWGLPQKGIQALPQEKFCNWSSLWNPSSATIAVGHFYGQDNSIRHEGFCRELSAPCMHPCPNIGISLPASQSVLPTSSQLGGNSPRQRASGSSSAPDFTGNAQFQKASGTILAVRDLENARKLEYRFSESYDGEEELEGPGINRKCSGSKPTSRRIHRRLENAKDKRNTKFPRGTATKSIPNLARNPSKVDPHMEEPCCTKDLKMIKLVQGMILKRKEGGIPSSIHLSPEILSRNGDKLSQLLPNPKLNLGCKSASRRMQSEGNVQNLSRQVLVSNRTTGRGPKTWTRAEKFVNAKRKVSLTWLTAIPYETPKTYYEKRRDEQLRDRKYDLDELGIVVEDGKAPDAICNRKTYNKRWTDPRKPEFSRITRLQVSERGSFVSKTRREENLTAYGADASTALEEPMENQKKGPRLVFSAVSQFSNGEKLQEYRRPYSEPGGIQLECYQDKSSTLTRSQLVSFVARGRRRLEDSRLSQIYTMDIGCMSNGHKAVMAVGGTQGRISIFALSDSPVFERSRTPLGDPHWDDSRCDAKKALESPLLLSWASGESWISQVIFLAAQFKEHEMLLLSSSNDGRVVLWDVNKVRIEDSAEQLSHARMPRVACQSKTLHSGCIVAMDEWEGRMATASDDSVGISLIAQTTIIMEKFIQGHHSGNVRSVNFRDQHVLADCGADMSIGVLDLRCADSCVLQILTDHKTVINSVAWNPGSENVLLSASLDPQLYLHDIRRAAKLLHVLEGHVNPKRVKCYSICRPTFIDGGRGVVSPGEGTNQLSVYSVATGLAIGKVNVGYDTTILLWSDVFPDQAGSLWASSHNVTQLEPVRTTS